MFFFDYRLLKSGFSMKDISIATRESDRIRKQRSETLRELRSKARFLVVQSSSYGKSREKQNVTTLSPVLQSSVSPTKHLLSPGVAGTTPPLKSRQRRQSTTPSKSLQQRRKLSKKFVLDINQAERRDNSRQQSVSPSECPAQLSFETGGSPKKRSFRTSQQKCEYNMRANCSLTQIVSSPKRQQSKTGAIFFSAPSPILSPKKAKNGTGRSNINMRTFFVDERNKENNVDENSVATPTTTHRSQKKRLQQTPPIKRRPSCGSGGIDKPLVIPRRLRTPPPSLSPIAATRMY
jgi:hypothetical protein